MFVHCVRVLTAFSAVLCISGAAFAQADIGTAIAIENRVEGQIGGDRQDIVVNSPVFRGQRITTYADSRGTFELADRTKLSLGAASEIVLDRFVYDPDSGTGDIVFNAARGAFRFVTGIAADNGYRVVTAVAAIGIRGTDFDVYNSSAGSLVLAREGIPYLCPRWLQNQLDQDHGPCCTLDAADAPLYAIVTRLGRRCVGPFVWDGTNPGRLLDRYVNQEQRRRDNDETRSSPPPRPRSTRPRDPS